MFVKSKVLEKIPGVIHAFGTKEEPVAAPFREKFQTCAPSWSQIHGIEVAHVIKEAQDCGNVDALYTEKIGVPIGVKTADCVPILLAEKSGKKIAAIHAGWKGTHGRILHHLWEKLAAEGELAENWVAAIGPAIGPCCYEVGEDLQKDFLVKFKAMDPKKVSPRPKYLDLPSINEWELKKLGFGKVEVLRLCTRCSQSPRFHSYRRQKEEGNEGQVRQYSLILREHT